MDERRGRRDRGPSPSRRWRSRRGLRIPSKRATPRSPDRSARCRRDCRQRSGRPARHAAPARRRARSPPPPGRPRVRPPRPRSAPGTASARGRPTSSGASSRPGVLGVRAGVLAGGSGHGLDGHAPAGRAALDLVARAQRGGGAHRGVGPDELGHAVEGVSRRVHDVAVLGGVSQDGRSGGRAASRATPSFTGPTNWTSTSASPRSGASFAASDGRSAGSTSPPASSTSRMSSRRSCAGAAQALDVVADSPRPGRSPHSALPRARRRARARALRGRNPAPRAGARTCQGAAIRRPRGTRRLTRPPRAAAATAR